MTASKGSHSDNILEKAKRYCAYQERAVSEVMKKLHEWKVKADNAGSIIEALREENFLDDERFATVFVSGKFSIKKWGRVKIRSELKLKKIPEEIIQKALGTINEEEYINALIAIIKKKKSSLADPENPGQRRKIINHALSKGYERHLIFKLLAS
ncbi:MAG: regulatory protein RecX [Bacteroidota bacterium]